jgi:hypothetical protein
MPLFFPGANSFDRVRQLRDDLSEHCLLGRRLLRDLHLLQLSRNRRKLKLSLNLLEGLVREIKYFLHRKCVFIKKKKLKIFALSANFSSKFFPRRWYVCETDFYIADKEQIE